MFEGSPKIESDGTNEHSVHFTRHTKAGYKTYKEILKSDNPQQAIDPEKQVTPDLSEQGVEMAQEAARDFFRSLNPATDYLFFASSDEARALETANIYKETAKEMGFKVLVPEHVRSQLAQDIGGGEIRVVDNLSLNIKNNLLGSIFNPESHLGTVNWSAVDPETKGKWSRARAIINADDRGSWGANFYHHSSEIKKIFPEIMDAEDEYNAKFQKLVRLAKFAIKKAEESNVDGNIKILAFGHENYVGYGLNKYFGDHELRNCETINIEPIGEELSLGYRGEETKI